MNVATDKEIITFREALQKEYKKLPITSRGAWALAALDRQAAIVKEQKAEVKEWLRKNKHNVQNILDAYKIPVTRIIDKQYLVNEGHEIALTKNERIELLINKLIENGGK